MGKAQKNTNEQEKRMTDAMHLFQQSYNNGYRLLKAFEAKKDGLAMLDNPESFKNFLANGKSISEVLGFSDHAIDKFYEAAHHMIAQKRYKEAKDAFFFLVTIAPQVSECWLGLGLAYGQCKETEGAIQSFLRAIALSPHKADGYVAFARLFTALDDMPRAQKVCDIGMSFVKEHEKRKKDNDKKQTYIDIIEEKGMLDLALMLAEEVHGELNQLII